MGDPLSNQTAILNEIAITNERALQATPGEDIDLGPTAQGTPEPLPRPPQQTATLGPGLTQWRVPLRGNYEALATYGEQGMAFMGFRMSEGWGILDGPSGAAGHPYNSPGFDGVAFHTTPDGQFELRIVDNKALTTSKEVRSASAITTNLTPNLDSLEKHLRQTTFDGVPSIDKVRATVAAARARLAEGQGLPRGVTLEVTNWGGVSTDVSQRLGDLGVTFRNLRALPPPSIAREAPTAKTTTMPLSNVIDVAVTPPPASAERVPVSPNSLPGEPNTTPRALSPPPEVLPSSAELASQQALTQARKRIATSMARVGETAIPMAAAMAAGLIGQYFVGKDAERQLDRVLGKVNDAVPTVAALAERSHPPGTQLYGNVTIRVVDNSWLDPELGWMPVPGRIELLSLQVSDENIAHEGKPRTEFGFGTTATYRDSTFSFPLPRSDAGEGTAPPSRSQGGTHDGPNHP